MNPDSELFMAIREAINDADGAAGSPDDLLTLQARAAIRAMKELCYFKAAGTEYAMRRDGVTEEHGFNTEEQARQWVGQQAIPEDYEIHHRLVGPWSATVATK
ncbi:hypothetical protein ACQCSX_04165 [Pseudarthrobacter sp. P1]|uniref:hypothetical protein n=1 Tax=Pseudarthrobacter sp. P1 TaxID=3418418 RepID=UPI003CF0F2C8